MKIKVESNPAVVLFSTAATAMPIVIRPPKKPAVAAVLIFAALIRPAAAAFQAIDYPSDGPGG
jgi:hypothetical protein